MSWDKVRKARQQLAREKGTIIKDWGGKLPIALVYPNSYYVGMSNLGLHAIYKQLNDHDEIVCERVFWEKEDEVNQAAPLSLESQRPLTDFAALAFTIPYEIDYFHVVQILRGSGIPLYATERDERHPLIIVGGPCVTANPMPLSPFFDCLCIGEAETILTTMLPVLSEGIREKRDQLLTTLTSLPGIYVPQTNSETPVARQWLSNLNEFPVASAIITPDTELGDLYLIEVQRGCYWHCRFCLVSNIYSPIRFRSIENILAQAKIGLKDRKRIGLVGPAVSEHPQIEELLFRLRQMGAGLSISSLRVSPLSQTILAELAKGGVQTVTLAPEAGSERLRQVINKNFSNNDILESMDKVIKQGIKQIKLYFMIGLPSEGDEDIEEIINLTLNSKRIIDDQHTGCRLSLNIAPFVPKAGTTFQWLPMTSISILNHRLSLIKKRLAPRGIKIKNESPTWSHVQGILARGDSKLATVLASMEEISLAGWRKAVENCHLDINFYTEQRWDTNEKLPWAILDTGIKPGQLKAELEKALT
ncbi:MAG: radical SAM protein [Dehalococcoidales bacterium]|nr:radical SAM protein [Dehalococcoidales bacterium]